MKNYEVGIIVVAIAVIGYLWWTNSGSMQTPNPTNAASPGYNPMLSNPTI